VTSPIALAPPYRDDDAGGLFPAAGTPAAAPVAASGPATLDALFQAIETEKATAATQGQQREHDAVGALLEHLGDQEGLALLEDLLAAGHSGAVIAALAQGSASDKRVRPKVALDTINGTRVVTLLSGGWAYIGQPNRRAALPTASTLRHRLAPANLERALARLDGSIADAAIIIAVERGVAMRQYIEGRVVEAKAAQFGNSARADVGQVLGGVQPDLLVTESWPAEAYPHRATLWPHTGARGQRQTGPDGATPVPWPDEEADFTVAVEVELSGKNDVHLARKVTQHNTAMALGWWDAVVWVTDHRDTVRRLERAGLVGASRRHPGHYATLTGAVHLGEADPSALLPMGTAAPWWPPYIR
jgi:hypothetical protein